MFISTVVGFSRASQTTPDSLRECKLRLFCNKEVTFVECQQQLLAFTISSGFEFGLTASNNCGK